MNRWFEILLAIAQAWRGQLVAFKHHLERTP
jgi:hypothetical protein